MALRAGYRGYKKLAEGLKELWPGILSVDNAVLSKTFFTRSEQSELGAVNVLKNNLSSTTAADITYTVADGVVTISALTGNKVLAVGQKSKEELGNTANVKLLGCPPGGSYAKYFMWWGIRNAGDTAWIESGREEGQGVILNIKDIDYSYIKVEIEVKVSQDYTLPLSFKPMITFNLDASYDDFTSYAKSNKQLTADVATNASILDDHKTAINGIISAATGAADFTAFKTAMAALTPLTRSAAPAERSLDVEVEEPVVVKKTTRKKTIKTEEEE